VWKANLVLLQQTCCVIGECSILSYFLSPFEPAHTHTHTQELQSGVPGLPGSSSNHSSLTDHFPFARALSGGTPPLNDAVDAVLLERVRCSVGDAVGEAPHALATLLDAAQVRV